MIVGKIVARICEGQTVSRFKKRQDREKTCILTVPEDPLAETSRPVRAEGRIIGDKVVYTVKAGLLKGFDCWLELCDCRTSCAREPGVSASEAPGVEDRASIFCRDRLALCGGPSSIRATRSPCG